MIRRRYSTLLLLAALLSCSMSAIAAQWDDPIKRAEAVSNLKTLGLPPEASVEEIQKAYRKLAMKYHPDRTHGDQASEELFKKIKKAYEDLGSPTKASSSSASWGNSAEWKKRYDFAYDFASRPISNKGMGWQPAAAQQWATQVATQYSSPIAVARFTLQYETALEFALTPAASGGLGKAAPEARDWAVLTASKISTHKELLSHIAKLRQSARSAGSCVMDGLKSRL